MEEIDTRLVEAERVKASWTPVQDLVIDSLSEHMDNLKVNAALKFIASLLPIAILKHIWMGRNHRSLFSCHRIFKSELRPCRTCLKRWAERRMNLGRRVCRSRQPCRAGLTSYTGVGNSCKFSFYRDSTHSKRLIPVLTWPLYQDSSVSSNGTHCKKQGLTLWAGNSILKTWRISLDQLKIILFAIRCYPNTGTRMIVKLAHHLIM